MEKRLALTIGLSLLVLLSWSALVSKTQPVVQQEVIQKEKSNITPNIPIKEEVLLKTPIIEDTQPILFSTNKLEVAFIEKLGVVKDIGFKDYNKHKFYLNYGFMIQDPTLIFHKENSTSESIAFVHQDSNKKITKKFIFSKSGYSMRLEIVVKNLTNAPLKINLPIILGSLDFSHKNPQSRYQDVAINTQEKTFHLNAQKNKTQDGIKFISLRDQYFCAIIQPEAAGQTGFINKISNQDSEVGLISQEFVIPVGSQIGHSYEIFIGPQDLKVINSINSNWGVVIYYGTFDLISQVLLSSLGFLHLILRNWGLAIIGLSILIYLVLYPLTLKQMKSMKEMQILQPKVEELRQRYKDNPQRQNKEIMQLYKEHKVNPLGGCLPLILQMPIFFALYNALIRSVVLKGAGFLWIKDLSEPDRLFKLPVSLPILGSDFNLLPILMAIGMFVQQKISSVHSTTGAAAEQQKIMLIVMPIVFGFIFYSMPSGLVIYWFTNSILMLVFQLRVNQRKYVEEKH